MTTREFPIQTERGAAPHPLLIPWSVAEKAYSVYAARYGRSQSLERLAERGGFAPCEMDEFLPGWRDEVSEITRLRKELAALRSTPPESRDTPTTGAGTAAYEEGYLHGLREYAHWNDGVQYVGTCGKTLADAIAEFKDERCIPSAASGAAGATTAAAQGNAAKE